MVDEGTLAIPEGVSDVENIGLCKKNGDVAVGVCGSVVLEGDSRAVELHSPLIFEDFRRNCSGGRGREGEVPALNSRRIREVLSRVRVRENNCTRRVQPFVAIGVVKVPMRVDDALDRIGADGRKRVGDLWTGAGKTSLDEELTFETEYHADVCASAHQYARVATEVL